jgi:hypothetical protein
LGRTAHETLAALFPADPPDFYSVPFGFHDTAVIVAFLRDAGFAEPRVTTVALEGVAPSAEDAAIGLVRGNPVLAEIQARAVKPEVVVDAVAAALRASFGAGPIRPPMRAHVVAALRP